MLFRPPTLDSEEGAVLERIERLRKELGFGLSPRRWFGLLRKNTSARAIRGSIGIEGFRVSVEDAMAAVENEEPMDARTGEKVALSGYQAAMTLVLQKADDPYFKYSSEFLSALQFMMVGHDLSGNPGRWRTGPIFVRDDQTEEVVYEGPSTELVPDLMEELVVTLNQPEGDLQAVVQGAMAHLNLVMIHPYADGNGRMARALQTLVLARSGITHPMFASIEEYLGRNTREYYDVLAEVGSGTWQPTRDTTPWIRFCLRAHFRQATILRRRSEYYQRLFDDVEAQVQRLKLPDRCIPAIAEAALGYRIRNATYRNSADVSEVTASRDLKAMVDAGLLVPKGSKRGRFYVASPALQAVADKIPKPQRAGDPFADVKSK